ncbi:alpha/beta hydrolase [Streptomyces griseocarneus]|uniref:alpha/beta hydrolase n=1 Tax=Streptomyces griseocarneus TaxID=51201 RepID=UPI00167E0B90|nr:alpha/beta hydrolase [Streptomyces griseocarneus]MBZ6475976.1 alpha/beta hydrolase [Streptomyces griseocarneus]GHG49743.1 peptidase [Streptomyces griseocarneus]
MFTFGKSSQRRAAVAASALVAAVVATALPASAAPSARSGSAVPARYAGQKLDWRACAEGSSLECATMTVPRDWHHPGSGADISVEVSRHRAGDAGKRRGVLMMAAGGPGGSGLMRPEGVVRASPAVGAAYDVVSFDQRGVGRSTRAVCQTDQEFTDFLAGDYRDRSPAAIRRVLDNSRAFVESCKARTGDLLPYLNTEQTVRDMDLLRSLLGAPRISYYGASYATMIGAYYATLFPQRVERAVLDSNVGFDGSWEEFMTGQPKSFQRRFEQDFLPWLAKYDGVYHYGRTVAEAKANWERRRAALREHPVTAGSVVIGPNQFDNGAIRTMYNAKDGFPALAQGLVALDRWESAGPAEKKLVGKVFGEYLSPEFLAEYFSVTCNDTPWIRDTGHWVDRSGKDTRDLPLVGARELAFSSVCAAWPASPAPAVKVTGKGLPTTLMLNSEHDPATHYEGALRAHRALRGSRLVTVTGGGDHGAYLGGNTCVDGIVEAYLLEDKAPRRDTACAAGPLPVPEGAAK